MPLAISPGSDNYSEVQNPSHLVNACSSKYEIFKVTWKRLNTLLAHRLRSRTMVLKYSPLISTFIVLYVLRTHSRRQSRALWPFFLPKMPLVCYYLALNLAQLISQCARSFYSLSPHSALSSWCREVLKCWLLWICSEKKWTGKCMLMHFNFSLLFSFLFGLFDVNLGFFQFKWSFQASGMEKEHMFMSLSQHLEKEHLFMSLSFSLVRIVV